MHFLEPPKKQKISILHCKIEIFCIFSITQKWISLPLGQTCGIYIFWSHQKSKKHQFYTVKWVFFAYFPFPRNGYPFWGKLWAMHFLEPPNMQKNSILHCKMEIFCIFSIAQKWISLPLGQTCGVCISWSHQICKKKQFYTVKWSFFAYFPFPSNEYLYSWGKLVGYAFSGATKKAKKIHFTV